MRKYIEDQLKTCVFANLDGLNSGQNTIVIPKYSKPKYDIGKCYLIKVSPVLLNNPHSITAANWNAGNYPTHQYLKAYVSRTKGKMLYVDCLAYNFETKQDMVEMWSGWVSIDEITQVAQLN